MQRVNAGQFVAMVTGRCVTLGPSSHSYGFFIYTVQKDLKIMNVTYVLK
jgi:hypothetical protein